MEGTCVVCGEAATWFEGVEKVFYCDTHKANHMVNLEGVDLGVTPRQLQAAMYASERYQGSELAKVLGVSVGRANAIVREAIQRLGVKDRQGLRELFKEMDL